MTVPRFRTCFMSIMIPYFIATSAAMTIGITIPATQILALHYQVSQQDAVFAVSAIPAAGAIFSPFGGQISDWLGDRITSLLGCAVMLATTIAAPEAGNWSAFIAVRLCEGLGFYLVVVSCGAATLRYARDSGSKLAMPIWSTYFPMGLTWGAFVAEAQSAGGRPTLILATIFSINVVLSLLLKKASYKRFSIDWKIYRESSTMQLTLAFGATALLQLGFLTLLPVLISANFNYKLQQAALITGLASISSIIGRLTIVPLRKKGLSVVHLIAGAAATTALLCVLALVFGTYSYKIFILTALSSSFFDGLLFSGLSALMPYAIADTKDAGIISGQLAQSGNIANMLAPLIFVSIYGAGGITGIATIVVLLALAVVIAIPRRLVIE